MCNDELLSYLYEMRSSLVEFGVLFLIGNKFAENEVNVFDRSHPSGVSTLPCEP
jgi:hypothetical protein